MVEEGMLLWEPSQEITRTARVSRYMEWLGRVGDYQDLWRWSVECPADFWTSIWDYFDVVGERGDGPVIAGTMPDVTWFQGATLNYAANVLRGDPDRTAVISRDETGYRRTYTIGELREEVGRVRAGLVRLGVVRGDRVAAYVRNTPEALIAMLATTSIGAIWSSCSPDFGAGSVTDRFVQIEPKVLIAVDGYHYGGKPYDRSAVVREIAAKLPTLDALVWIPTLDTATAAGAPIGVTELTWQDLRAEPAELEFEQVPFDHPLWVLYSSGTTGLPKPIVHGHGGIVLEHVKTLALHNDLGEGDVYFWYSTTGWTVWNIHVSGLMVGATLVLYDGSATYPETGALWRLAAEEGITFFGTSAPYILACMKAGVKPTGLDQLRGIGSTASPLPPEGFAWVYSDVKSDVLLASFSGGTDLCTGFLAGMPLLPVRAGVIQCRCLGVLVESYGPSGESLVDEVGELVITQPLPSMPIMFWNDPSGERYRESYFADYPGVWRHGDWIKIRPDGGCVIYGRSDSTLNRGGVRMGTSEFYRVVERFEEIEDSLVIDTSRAGAEGKLLLYVTLSGGAALTDDLVSRLHAALRTELSPRHVPNEIHQVPGIPRTLSGKKLEIPVRKILLGAPVEQVANPDAMANPEVLRFFRPTR